MTKVFWKCALIRALRTVAQVLAGTLPAGLSITPTMIENADWTILYAILAWLLTGLFCGLISILNSIATGLPEVEDKKVLNDTIRNNK